jgi:MFS family permease
MSQKKIPKQVKILGFISLFTDMASEMLYPITPIFLTAVLGSSMAVVGLIEGLAEITAGFFKGYFGRLSDKLGRRSIFVRIGYGLSALTKPLPGIFPHISTVLFARVTDRVGKGIRTAPRDALLASYSENNSGAIFGFHRGMDTLGAALGPAIALGLLYFFPENYILIFLVAFIPSVIAVGFTAPVKDKPVIISSIEKNNYKLFWNTSSSDYKKLLLLITIFSLVNSSDVFLILKSKVVSGSSTQAILGYIFYNIIYASSSYPIGKISDKFGKKNIFISGLLIFSLVYLGFAISSHEIIIWILFAFYGIYAAATEGIAKAWVSDLIPDQNRGTAIGLLTMFSSIAIMAGSFLTGILWDQFGAQVPFFLSSAVSFVVVLLFFSIKTK